MQERSGEDVWNVASWKSEISSKVLFIRQNLKKQVPPSSWKRTLSVQEVYFVTALKRCTHFDISEEDLDNVDVIGEIVDEFIFNEGKELSALQELQLLEIICSHFQSNIDEICRYLQFATMFNLSPHDEIKEFRLKILSKLLSMSIGLECSSILDCVGAWIMKHRSYIQEILDLIQAIIYDYCILVPSSLPALESMVKHSTLFSSQFLTAVTVLYPMYKLKSEDEQMTSESGMQGSSLFPPRSLLQLVADWITCQPGVLLTSYPQHLASLPNCRMTNEELAPPSTKDQTRKLPLCPLHGLVRWSILGPICFISQKHGNVLAMNDECKSIMLVFSKLQFGVLQTFLATKKQLDEKDHDNDMEPGEVMEDELDYTNLLSIYDLRGICMELLQLINEIPSDVSVDLRENLVHTSVDRLAQVLQVGKSSECLSGKKRTSLPCIQIFHERSY